jgi:hypothetical protein
MVMIASFPQSPTSTHFLPQHYTLGFSGIKRQDLKKRKNFGRAQSERGNGIRSSGNCSEKEMNLFVR